MENPAMVTSGVGQTDCVYDAEAIGIVEEILSNTVDRHTISGEYARNGREQLLRLRIALQHLGLAIRELDTRLDENDDLVNPIRESFERENPKEKLDKLIQSASIRRKAPSTTEQR